MLAVRKHAPGAACKPTGPRQPQTQEWSDGRVRDERSQQVLEGFALGVQTSALLSGARGGQSHSVETINAAILRAGPKFHLAAE